MKHIVIDTGYLLHLFDVDGRTSAVERDAVREKFKQEADLGSIFYVPVPVIFELCNFIAQVGNGGRRRQLASSIKAALEGSLASSVPWTIAPFEGDDSMRDWIEVLNDALTTFDAEYVHQQIGLTDISVVRQAANLKKATMQRPQPRPLVHIWTVDQGLKAREPDSEQAPYL